MPGPPRGLRPEKPVINVSNAGTTSGASPGEADDLGSSRDSIGAWDDRQMGQWDSSDEGKDPTPEEVARFSLAKNATERNRKWTPSSSAYPRRAGDDLGCSWQAYHQDTRAEAEGRISVKKNVYTGTDRPRAPPGPPPPHLARLTLGPPPPPPPPPGPPPKVFPRSTSECEGGASGSGDGVCSSGLSQEEAKDWCADKNNSKSEESWFLGTKLSEANLKNDKDGCIDWRATAQAIASNNTKLSDSCNAEGYFERVGGRERSRSPEGCDGGSPNLTPPHVPEIDIVFVDPYKAVDPFDQYGDAIANIPLKVYRQVAAVLEIDAYDETAVAQVKDEKTLSLFCEAWDSLCGNVDIVKLKACLQQANLVQFCGVWETIGDTSTFTRWKVPGQLKLLILKGAGFVITPKGTIEEAPTRVRRYDGHAC